MEITGILVSANLFKEKHMNNFYRTYVHTYVRETTLLSLQKKFTKSKLNLYDDDVNIRC